MKRKKKKETNKKGVTLVDFMYPVFIRMPGENYRRQLGSLLLSLCDVFRGLINSLVSWFFADELKRQPDRQAGREGKRERERQRQRHTERERDRQTESKYKVHNSTRLILQSEERERDQTQIQLPQVT